MCMSRTFSIYLCFWKSIITEFLTPRRGFFKTKVVTSIQFLNEKLFIIILFKESLIFNLNFFFLLRASEKVCHFYGFPYLARRCSNGDLSFFPVESALISTVEVTKGDSGRSILMKCIWIWLCENDRDEKLLFHTFAPVLSLSNFYQM